MRHEPTEPIDVLRHEQRRARRPQGTAPIARPRAGGRVLAGVAVGIARFVGTDVRLVRVLWVVSVVPSLGITVLGYLALWLLLPLDANGGGAALGAVPPPRTPSVDGTGRGV
ncbi:MAG: PspC domain-containing protein [Trueperaceae bacterium]|nr:MAG: PspC domain-containing protein [Trueperaceae bacterium]